MNKQNYLLGLLLSIGMINENNIDICLCKYDRVFCKKLYKLYDNGNGNNRECGFYINLELENNLLSLFKIQKSKFRNKYHFSNYSFPNTSNIYSFIRGYMEGNMLQNRINYHDKKFYITGELDFLTKIGQISWFPFQIKEYRISDTQISEDIQELVTDYINEHGIDPTPEFFVEMCKECCKVKYKLTFGKNTMNFLQKIYEDSEDFTSDEFYHQYQYLCIKNGLKY